MIETFSLAPGITLRCFQDDRFRQGFLSLQFLRSMCREEAAMNALLPAVLLRGCRGCPDLRAITNRLDDLYGAGVSALVRRIGDYQTTGLSCAFISDRFALEGDRILEPMLTFLGQLLLEPVTEDGGFSREFVESEKKNLISALEAERNDKRAYAAAQLMKTMCREDSFGIPRLGTVEGVSAIDHRKLYDHYETVLRESPVEIFYAGSAQPQQIADAVKTLFAGISRCYVNLPAQTPFHTCPGSSREEEMEVAQAKLCMGFTTPITNQSREFAAMQVCNALFGGGPTSKLFLTVREQMSLCYSIGSGYYSTKGILTVSAGIDSGKKDETQQQILKQLDACRNGQFTPRELEAAKAAVISSLRSVHDSPGAIEGYYATAAISGLAMTPAEYIRAVEAVTAEQVSSAAGALQLHTTYFLKEATVC